LSHLGEDVNTLFGQEKKAVLHNGDHTTSTGIQNYITYAV